MIMTDLRGKKLLLVGGLNNTVDLIDLAHRNGVTVGVADYNHGTLAKSLADYAFDVNAYDEDAMVKFMDATDALGAAYCHYMQMNRPESQVHYRGWKDFIVKNQERVKK